MATIVTIDGKEYKKRSPWGAWGLCFTVVYAFIWYFKVNKELKQYLRDDSRPGLRTAGAIVPILSLVIHHRLGTSVQRAEETTGIAKTVEPFLVILAMLVYFVGVPYVQDHLNKVWDAAAARGSAPAETAGPGGPPPIPPPPPTQ